MHNYFHWRELNGFCKTLIFSLFYALLVSHTIQAQTYSGTISHDGIYAFDYTIVCGSPANTALVTLEYTTSEPLGVVPQLHLGGGSFVNMAGPSPYTYTLTGLTDCAFSFQFYIAWMAGGLYQSPTPLTQNNFLPVELFKFNVQKNKNRTLNINWWTATEKNSAYYLIQRSVNSLDWQNIATVEAAGNSSTTTSYSYTDDVPIYAADGYCYYRLKMVDSDGSFDYSPIRVIQLSDEAQRALRLYPNPSNGNLHINFSDIDWSYGTISMQVYNVHGQQVHAKTFNRAYRNQINLDNWAPSIYLFRFIQKGGLIYQTKISLSH